MKKWDDFSNLGLLDDGGATELPPRAWEDLTKTATRAPKVVPTLDATAARPAPRKPETKVFSSRPTLRQMMQDYNRRSARTAPIKAQGAAPLGETHFSFQSVDLIQIPVIPGKILRPAPPRDADT